MKATLSKGFLFGFLVLSILLLLPLDTEAAVSVRGYYRSNGTYVQPHYRSSPDGNPYNNWTYPGNTNPYTGKVAPGNVSTYLDNYYNRSSSYSGYSPSYSTYNGLGSSYYSNYSSGISGSSYYGSDYLPSYSSSKISIEGGYKIGSILYCNTGYYEFDSECKKAPLHSTAYGGTSFYCDTGYEKIGNECKKKGEISPVYYNASSNPYIPTTNSVREDGCRKDQTWYFNKCVDKMENAKYNGSTYTCNSGYFVNKAGNQCVGIDSWCKEKYGYGVYGLDNKCYCNGGLRLDTTTNTCKI